MTDRSAHPSHKGYCRCGGIRVTVCDEAVLSVYCHCDDCRRSTGSAVLASVGFSKEQVTWTNDVSLGAYVAGTCARLFCTTCGSPIAQLHESAADKIFFNTTFMDDPESFPPAYHTFVGQRLEWLKLADDLPRHDSTVLIKVSP